MSRAAPAFRPTEPNRNRVGIVGQMLGSLTFDHFGLLGLPQHAASPVRVTGAACLIVGVVLVRI